MSILQDAEARHPARQHLSRPLVNSLHERQQEERAKLSRHTKAADARGAMFEKDGSWPAVTPFLEQGRIWRMQKAGAWLGGMSWRLTGSKRGAARAAMNILIIRAKPKDMPVSRRHDLLPWSWKQN